jgi:hypothetical protein
MRTKGLAVAVAALAVVTILGSPAGAVQLAVKDNPEISGPLVRVSKFCGRQTDRQRGRAVAHVSTCSYLYRYKPAKENNDRRNFGVAWLQTSLNAAKGWCARRMRSTLTLSATTRQLSWAPRDESTDRRKTVTTRVRADAQGSGQAVGVVQQDFVLRPRRINSTLQKDPDKLVLRWRGSTPWKIGFALGVEISWRRRQEPAVVGSGLGYELERKADCRA